MRKPTTIKAEIAENKELLKAAGLLADERAFIEDEIADLEKELEEALKSEATPKKPTATKKAAPKKKTTTKKKSAAKKKTTTKKTTPAKPKEKKFVMVGDEKVFEDDPKFCEIIIDKWKARKEAIKKAAGTRKTKSVIQRAAADVADAVSKGIRNFKVDEIKKDPKKAIAKMEKLEKAGKEFIDAYKDIIGEKITQKEIKEEFEGLDKAIKQISEKYLKEKQKMEKGGETNNDLTPGSTYTFSDGFAWEIVSKKEAKDIFLDDGVVFGLNINEETEGMIEDEEDLDAYEVFAVEKETMANGGKTEKVKYKLKYDNGDFFIHKIGDGGVKINEKIFDEELFDYRIVDRDGVIDDLTMWISETKSASDKQLMKDDLKDLLSWNDEYVFSNINTNEFIGENTPEWFNSTAEDLIELNESLK